MAWVGLAKAGDVREADLVDAFDAASDDVESVLVGLAGAWIGNRAILERGLHLKQRKLVSLWRLAAPIPTDFVSACEQRLGDNGKLLAELFRFGI